MITAATVFSDRQKILITGNNVEITPTLKERIADEIGKVIARHTTSVRQVDVHCVVAKSDRQRAVGDNHKCEATLYFIESGDTGGGEGSSRGIVVRVAERADNMYPAIEKTAAVLQRKLRKLKERGIAARTKGAVSMGETAAEADDLPSGLDAFDLEVGNFEAACAEGDVECELALIAEAETARLQADGAGEAEVAAAASAATAAAEGEARLAATVVRRKTFEMPAMSIEDAAVALDYIDHDFYVFRNAATNEVNVLYRRNSGGVGLIEPDEAR